MLNYSTSLIICSFQLTIRITASNAVVKTNAKPQHQHPRKKKLTKQIINKNHLSYKLL